VFVLIEPVYPVWLFLTNKLFICRLPNYQRNTVQNETPQLHKRNNRVYNRLTYFPIIKLLPSPTSARSCTSDSTQFHSVLMQFNVIPRKLHHRSQFGTKQTATKKYGEYCQIISRVLVPGINKTQYTTVPSLHYEYCHKYLSS